MAIVINGSGTVTGLAVGGLPDGTVDTDTLANTTVTAAKVAADVATQAEIDAKLNLAGGTMTGEIVLNSTNLTCGDSTSNANKIRMGASDDLNIHHDGTHSYIEDSGTGALRLLGSSIELRNAPQDNELMLKATVDGSVELYYNNAKKLETTLKGVQATGTMAAGATPLELYSGYSGVQVGSNAMLFGQHSAGADRNFWLSQNSYADGSGAEKAISTGAGSSIQMASGSIVFRTNASVSAGSSITNKNTLIMDAGNVCNFRRYDVANSNFERILAFKDGSGTERGNIKINNANVQYNTSSDYRLKENVNYTWDATTRLKQLKPARFNWITDDTNTLVDGFIAHEAQTVVPESVSGTKDAMMDRDTYDAIGNVNGTENVIDPQGIDQSKLVPLLVKTIQELEARITALEA